jgi:hypothetical protein
MFRVLSLAVFTLMARLAYGQGTPQTPPPQTPPPQTPPPQPAPTPAPPAGPTVRVGGTFFADYTYTASPETTDADGNRVNPSSFNVKRTYINITGSLNRVIAFRFTPDIAEEAGSGTSLNGSLVFRVKYAYLQTNLDRWTTAGTWARFGMQPTPWVNFEEDIYRYRFQGTVFADREGFLSSSDAGAAMRFNFPNGFGEIQAGVYNGETYRRVEANDQKAWVIRGTARPFAKRSPALRGLLVSAFYHGDHYVKNADRTRAIVSAIYEHKYVNAAGQYLKTADQTSARAVRVEGSGYSLWATPRFQHGWGALLRYDHLSPNAAVDGQTKSRTIVGGAYWVPLPAGVTTVFLLDYERVGYEGFTPSRPTEQRIALHAQLTF